MMMCEDVKTAVPTPRKACARKNPPQQPEGHRGGHQGENHEVNIICCDGIRPSSSSQRRQRPLRSAGCDRSGLLTSSMGVNQRPRRSKTRLTCDACHVPPRAVATPEELSASAISLREAPCDRNGCTNPATLSARALALA